jgi:ABC-type sugar transport system substrate-binding protein
MRHHASTDYGGRKSPRGWRVGVAAFAIVAGIAVVSTIGAGATPRPAATPHAPSAQSLVNKAFGTHIALSTLPPEIRTAFVHAAMPLTKAQLDKAYACWVASSCTVGKGKVTLAIADGFGDNTWRHFTKMEGILEALTFPQIGKIVYTNAGGNLATMESQVRSLVAQGVKAIVTYDDFGTSMDPTFQYAESNGAYVSSYVGGIPNAPTSAVFNQIHPNLCVVGKQMADRAAQIVHDNGQVAYFNGTPGNPQGAAWNACATAQFANNYPKVKVTFTANTDWTPAGAEQAAAAAIGSGKPIKVILYDYANPLVNVVQTYQHAKKKVPAFVTWTEDNQLFQQWQAAHGTSGAFGLYYTNGVTWVIRASVTAVVDKLAGKSIPSTLIYPQPFLAAKVGDYQVGRPGDYPGTSTLIPPSVITRMLG